MFVFHLKNVNKLLIVTFSLILVQTGSGGSGFICPEVTGPCRCTNTTISCHGPQVNQSSIDQIFQDLRDVNNKTHQEWLNIDKFTIDFTNLTTLDLTPLARVKMDIFLMYLNVQLTSVTGPFNFGEPILKVRKLDWPNNNLNDEGLEQVFKYLDKKALRAVNLNYNKIKGPALSEIKVGGDDETTDDENLSSELALHFLPGLSSFPLLTSLELNHNLLTVVSTAQFQNFDRLQLLDLSYNKIGQLAENSLLFKNLPADSSSSSDIFNRTLKIFLQGNLLNSDSLRIPLGLEKKFRPILLNFKRNPFDHLDQEKFKGLLCMRDKQAFPLDLLLGKNNFTCTDKRISWITNASDEVRNHIYGFKCKYPPVDKRDIYGGYEYWRHVPPISRGASLNLRFVKRFGLFLAFFQYFLQ